MLLQKRESGANPEQSRCCKAGVRLSPTFIPLKATVYAYGWEGREDRPSQKTCLQDMPSKSFRGKAEHKDILPFTPVLLIFTALTKSDAGSLNLPRDEKTT